MKKYSQGGLVNADLIKRLYDAGQISEGAFRKYAEGGLVTPRQTAAKPANPLDEALLTAGVATRRDGSVEVPAPMQKPETMDDIDRVLYERARQIAAPLEQGMAASQATSMGMTPAEYQEQVEAVGPQTVDVEMPAQLTTDVARQQAMPAMLMPQGMGGAEQVAALESSLRALGQAQQVAAQDQRRALAQAQMVEQNEAEAQAARLEEQRQKIDQAVKRYESFDPREFQKALWTNQSTPQKIAIGVALLFGAVGAQSDGVNRVAADIERRLNEDLQLAENRREQLGRLADAQRSVYNDLRQQGFDQQTTRAKMLDMQLGAIKAQVDQFASRVGTEEAIMKAKAIGAEIDARRAQAQSQMNERLMLQSVASGQGKMTLAQAQMLPEDARKRFVPEFGAVALTDAGAMKVNDLAADVNKAKSAIQEMIAMGKSNTALNPPARKRAAALQAELIGAIRLPFVGPGVLDQKEQARLEGVIPNPLELTSISAQTRLEQLSRRLDTALRGSAQAYGVAVQEPVKESAPVRGR